MTPEPPAPPVPPAPPELGDAELAFLRGARTATLATIGPDGRPRLVPICFVVSAGLDAGRPVLYSPLDDKPKSTTDLRSLARVRDIVARPAVSLLVDRWSEDWTELAWLRLDGRATLLEPGQEQARAIAALRARYPQYADHALDGRPLIRVVVERGLSWGSLR